MCTHIRICIYHDFKRRFRIIWVEAVVILQLNQVYMSANILKTKARSGTNLVQLYGGKLQSAG